MTGVLFMAYGGPGSLEEIPGYLADIRSGRPTSRAVVEEISDHYARIGGRSPLLELTSQQVEAVSRRLSPYGYRCYLGMRHWSPWIEEVVGQMVRDGISRAVSVVLAPHYSRLSVARYQERIARGLHLCRGTIEFRHVNSYHDREEYIDALADRVTEGLAQWPAAARAAVHVVFSAHSLPVSIVSEGDPYDTQLKQTATLVAGRCGIPDSSWSWSYQSAGMSPGPWLGPQLEDYIPVLASQGRKDLLCAPIGFVADHVEILYDIDIEAQAVARDCGVTLRRTRALNDTSRFVDALAGVVRDASEDWIDGSEARPLSSQKGDRR